VSADQAIPPTGSTMSYLAGHWNVARRISDRRTGHCGSFVGKASFQPSPEATRYLEQGELEFGGHRGPASRNLIYRGRRDGGADVQFADGREFYTLDLSPGSWRAEHICRDDRYQVTVTWLSPDSFSETWRVAGPAKDYEMTTTYTRAGNGQ
jgi:hypothetical protein